MSSRIKKAHIEAWLLKSVIVIVIVTVTAVSPNILGVTEFPKNTLRRNYDILKQSFSWEIIFTTHITHLIEKLYVFTRQYNPKSITVKITCEITRNYFHINHAWWLETFHRLCNNLFLQFLTFFSNPKSTKVNSFLLFH